MPTESASETVSTPFDGLIEMPSRIWLIRKVLVPFVPETVKPFPAVKLDWRRKVIRRLFPVKDAVLELRIYISKGMLVDEIGTPEIPFCVAQHWLIEPVVIEL